MAITIPVAPADHAVSIEEYLDWMTREISVDDIDAVLSTADRFAALLANQNLIVEALNKELRKWRGFQNRNHYSAQTFVLGISNKFVVRANVWMPPSNNREMREWEDKFYYYRVPHDHNFSFMTGGYYGSGYATRIFEYDPETVTGESGEAVQLRFLEHTRLPKGKVMFYRASRDVHSQEHPEEFSISVNLLVVDPKASLRTQYQFDLNAATLTKAVENTSSAQRMLTRAAKHLGNSQTLCLLDELATTHPTPRFRASCYDALLDLEPSRTDTLIRRAEGDKHAFVRRFADAAARGSDDRRNLLS